MAFDAYHIAHELEKHLLTGGRTFAHKNGEPDLEDGEVNIINGSLHVQVGYDYLILCRETEDSITFIKETKSITTLVNAIRKELAARNIKHL